MPLRSSLAIARNSMQIELGKGIEDIVFGATKEAIISHWGKPTIEYVDESGDHCIAYFSKKVSLRFENEQSGKLTWIECANPRAELLGLNVFDQQIDELTYKIETRTAEEPETFTHGWLQTFFYAEDWLELQLQFGELCALNFGVHYDERDRPIWPNP